MALKFKQVASLYHRLLSILVRVSVMGLDLVLVLNSSVVSSLYITSSYVCLKRVTLHCWCCPWDEDA